MKKLFLIKEKILIIDGILGIGVSRKPAGLILKSIKFINKIKSDKNTIVSIDIPSGLNPNNGVAYPTTVNADYTMMCLTRKQACYTGDGVKFSGKLYYTDLGLKNIGNNKKTSSILINYDRKVLIKR